jgi:hypothetical protein
VVLAADSRKWGPYSRFIQRTRADSSGRFTVEGLPPGSYVAIASSSLPDGEEGNPDRLARWLAGQQPFELRSGKTETLELRVTD